MLVVWGGCSFTPYRSNYMAPDFPRYAMQCTAGEIGDDHIIKIVSYNIKYSRNIEEAIKLFTGSPDLTGADIICLQEMDSAGTEKIARTLGYNYVYYPSSHDPRSNKDFGPAIISRFPIKNDRKIILPPFYHKKKYKIQRIAVIAELFTGKHDLIVISTHLSVFISPLERAQQMKVILDEIGTTSTPCILAGDFNTFTARHKTAVGKELESSGFTLASSEVKWTYKNWFILNKKSVYDFIFVRGLTPQCSGALLDLTVSDHLPVWTHISLP